jgi:hypothetical protein
MKLPFFLDFEASSLSSCSYPIEVAWSRSDGSIESYLISPVGIEAWDDWSVLSEKVHGISRAELKEHGKSPDWICDLMNRQLIGQVVYTDNPIYDGMWLAELFSVSKVGRLKFRLGLVDEVLFARTYSSSAHRAAARNEIQNMKDEARRLVGGQHRARLDVLYLIELYKLATQSHDFGSVRLT